MESNLGIYFQMTEPDLVEEEGVAAAASAAAAENGEVYEIIQFFIEGVLTAALGIFGILGNIVSIKVRRIELPRSSASRLSCRQSRNLRVNPTQPVNHHCTGPGEKGMQILLSRIQARSGIMI